MGIEQDWKNDLITSIRAYGIELNPYAHKIDNLYISKRSSHVFLLSGIATDLKVEVLVDVMSEFLLKDMKFIHIWQDIW
ncbi:MAG: hypothetical protein EOP48_15135, partial [Sphingobacteriales bacterium]